MTKKKQEILNVALELFGINGCDNVSTKMIANKANVSEGLIFKHFKNKLGLINSIIELAEEKVNLFFQEIIDEEDPKIVIKMLIEFPFQKFTKEQFLFWQFEFKIKWENKYHNPNLIKPLRKKLLLCFKKMDYENPEYETETLLNLFDGICTKIIRSGKRGNAAYKKFLLEKYLVS